jgi:hypothetical protein
MSIIECSSGSDCEDDEKLKIEPKLDTVGKVLTEEGEQSIEEFAEKEDNKRINVEFQDINESRIAEMGRDRRHSRKRDGNRLRGVARFPLIDEDARFMETGYVKTRTKEGIMLEELEKIRNNNLKLYESRIRENISDLATSHVLINESKKKISSLHRYQVTLSVLLALTLKEFKFNELLEFLDECIQTFNPELSYRFSNDAKKVENILWTIKRQSSDNRYMRKFVILKDEDNIVREIKFSLNPILMELAALNYHDLRKAWFVRLPTEDKHIPEEELLKILPKLSSYAKIEDPSKRELIIGDDGLTDELRKIKHDNESNRRRIEKASREEFNKTTSSKNMDQRRMPKGEFMGYVMTFHDKTVMTKVEWHKEFKNVLKNWIKGKQSVSFNKIETTETYTFLRKIQKQEFAISKFVYTPPKSNVTHVIGLHPALSRVKDISHITTMIYSVREGNKLITEYTTKGYGLYDIEIAKAVYPVRFKESLKVDEIVDDVETIDETEIVESETPEIETKTVESVQPLSKIANAIEKVIDNGIQISFNINFGKLKKEPIKQEVSTSEFVKALNEYNEYKESVLAQNEKMDTSLKNLDLLMKIIYELIEELK